MRRKVWVTLGIIVLLVMIFGNTLASLYTDWLWYGEVGYRSVFFTELWSKLELGLLAGIVFFAAVYANVLLARKLAPPGLPRYSSGDLRVKVGRFAQRGFGLLVLVATVVVSFMVALEASSHWMSYQMCVHATSFGKTDPIFHRDVSFYVFQLGFMRYIYGWLFFTLIVAAIATAIIHYTDKAIDFLAGTPTFAPHVKAHLSLLFAGALFVKAWGYWLDRYGLLNSSGGVVYGAGFTDVHANLFAYNVLIVVAIIAGILALANIKRRGIKLPAVALIILIGTSFLLGVVYPNILQQVYVKPNELAREKQFINYNIEATRAGFGLDSVSVKNFPALENLTAKGVQDNSATINSIRLWDYRPIHDTYTQLQALGPYYKMDDVDVDRYSVNGEIRQVMLSARELSLNNIGQGSDSWVNRHFQYTHGYSAVVSPVNKATSEGLPVFFTHDMPPTSTVGIDINQPQIYFGEQTSDYAIVDSGSREFDYPAEGTPMYTRYAGKGGIDISSYLNRIAFAWRFGDTNLMLSNPITTGSKLLFRRNVSSRVRTILPFLTYEPDPYLVISKGNMYWMQDAYTSSDMYPYSKMVDSTDIDQRYGDLNDDISMNYIRNAVKVVMDAYNGSVNYYIADDVDPLLKTYAKIFPGVFKPMSAMSMDLQAHLRYPEVMFKTQWNILCSYHVQDPQVFYNGSDLWDIPKEITGIEGQQTPIEPYYVVMTLPDEKSEEFLLMEPFTPKNKSNMIAWMAARCDPKVYGKLIVYQFPKQNVIYGPAQIESTINQDPTISQLLTLLNQQGSHVNRGNLLVIPIEQSIIYIKPLYIESESSKIPELKKVVVAYGSRVEMSDTLEGALNAIFGSGAAPSAEAPVATSSGAKPTVSPGAHAPSSGVSSVKKLIDQAADEFNKAQEAQRKGDWSGYGEQQKRLQETLKQLQKAGM